MRKIYSLFLVMLMLPMLAMAADNQAIYKAVRTTMSTTDYRAYVDPSILKPVVEGEADSYTFGTWVKISQMQSVSNLNNNMLIMGYGGREHCNDNGCWNIVVNSSGSLEVTGWGTQGAKGVVSNSTFSTEEWHHVMVSYDSDAPSMTFFLDGAQIDRKDMEAKHTWFTNENPAIYFAGFGFNGLLDEVQIYNRALSAEEVTKAYKNANAVDGLVGLYTFDEIAEGTTSQYANQSKQDCASALNMTWEKITGLYCWNNGITYVITQGSTSEAAPTTEEGREVAYNVQLTIPETVEGGSITVTVNGETKDPGTYTIENIDDVIVTATPDDGYQLVKILAGETEVASGVAFNIDADAEISAIFSNESYAITVENAANLTYSLTKADGSEVDPEAIAPGTTLRLTIEVPESHIFNSVKLNGETLTKNATDAYYEFQMPEADATLTIDARAKAQYTVTIEKPEGGSVTVSNGATAIASGDQIYEGTTLTLSAASESGHQFVNFLVDGKDYTSTTVTPTADITISAVFEEGIDYCTPTPVSGATVTTTTTFAGRGITSLTINAGENSATITGSGTTRGRKVYTDATSTIITAEPGQTVSIVAAGAGVWMNTYIYADFDLNGFTTADKVFDNYTGNENSIAGTYTFTIPADQASGTYRVRYKVDWEDQDPCLYGQSGKDNGDVVIDFLLLLPKQILDEPRTVTVATENEEYGTVAITSPATDENSVTTDEKTVTVKATPADGMAFMNWTNSADEVVATTATYSYTGETDETLTAHFGHSVDYTVSANGTATILVNNTSITSGTVVAPGTEITVNVTPASGKEALLQINGSYVDLENNTYTFTVSENVEIAIEFTDKINRLTVNATGNVSVEMWQASDADNINLPAGSMITDGGVIPSSDNTGYDNFVIYFIPGKNSENVYDRFVSASYSIGSVTTQIAKEDLYEMDTDAGEPYKNEATLILEIPKADVSDNLIINVAFTGTTQGIEEIGTDKANGPVEYYNLQGVRVASENLAPGFYIVRQGTTTEKVLIRK